MTGIDFSPMMIDKAKRAAAEYSVQAEFLVGDIEAVEIPEEGFDTVVSTQSLCAYSDPLRVLHRMSRWCADTGRILLYEHGKSNVAGVTWLLDLLDPIQLRTVGCHLNRDILGLMSQSPLRVEHYESHLLGMVHVIWARPTRESMPLPNPTI